MNDVDKNTLFGPRSYTGVLLLAALAMIPGLDMVQVKCSQLVWCIAVLPFLAIFVAVVVCLAREGSGKLRPAPKSLFATILLLMVPYTSALSTAIKSFGDEPSGFGYWGAVIELVIVIPCIIILWVKERRASKTAQA